MDSDALTALKLRQARDTISAMTRERVRLESELRQTKLALTQARNAVVTLQRQAQARERRPPMSEPAVDPNALRRALERLDETRKLLTRERMRAAQYKARLAKAQRITNAKPQQHEQRPAC